MCFNPKSILSLGPVIILAPNADSSHHETLLSCMFLLDKNEPICHKAAVAAPLYHFYSVKVFQPSYHYSPTLLFLFFLNPYLNFAPVAIKKGGNYGFGDSG
jgi:hypothetical protein